MIDSKSIAKAKKLIVLHALVSVVTVSCAGLFTDGSALAEFEKGLSLYDRGEYKKASVHFIRATELDPEYTKAYIYLGRSYIGLKQWYSALKPLRTAYRISPEQTRGEVSILLVDVLFFVVTDEIKKGNFDASSQFLAQYLDLNKSLNNTNNRLVSFLIAYAAEQLNEGNLGNSVSALETALEIDPKNSDAYTELGRAYLKDGRIFDALNNIRKAIVLDPENEDARNLLKEYRY